MEIAISLLLLIGGSFTLLGSIGLTRLPDFYTRLHGPTKATTLGVGAICAATVMHSSYSAGEVSWQALSILLFLFISAPITAHLMSKAARKIDLEQANKPSSQN